MTDFDRDDLAALTPFLLNDRHSKLEALMKDFRKRVQKMPEAAGFKSLNDSMHFADGAVRESFLYGNYNDSKLSLEWGLSAGNNKGIFEKENPGNSLQLFVFMQGPSEKLRQLKNRDDWKLMGDEGLEWWGQWKDVADLLSKGSFTESAFEWLEPKIKEGMKLLKIAAGDSQIR